MNVYLYTAHITLTVLTVLTVVTVLTHITLIVLTVLFVIRNIVIILRFVGGIIEGIL